MLQIHATNERLLLANAEKVAHVLLQYLDHIGWFAIIDALWK